MRGSVCVPHRLSAAPAPGCEHESGPVGAGGASTFPSPLPVSRWEPADAHSSTDHGYKRVITRVVI